MNEELQQKYLELQTLNSQLKQVQQQIMNFEQQVSDLNAYTEYIDDFKAAKEGSEVLAPIGTGLFVKASLKDSKEIIMHVGAKIHVTKTPEEAKEVIKKQTEEMQKMLQEMASDFQAGVARANQLQKELHEMQHKH